MKVDNRRLAMIEDGMADVAAAGQALERLWCHLLGWAKRPAVTMEELDAIGCELREIELGLAAAKRALQQQREECEK